ncbi:MAG TPA: glycosyltransferase family 39 protein [Chthoniobacteraceae bacterium]|jgi:4-amino-4-deoxy-L-arabinose transferase-like glycosyltransferase|nr:glycosyltransferase family 39 protein [Chthoniobacteraceae bacterium]
MKSNRFRPLPSFLLLLPILGWLAAYLCHGIRRPWIDFIDFNGAVWSQSAHNILRAGLWPTFGAATGFYFGPLPIPASGFYLHHPPLLHLTLACLFAIFGEHEWVARAVPIACSLSSIVFLWFLVRSCAGARTATWGAAVFALLPMELRYGRMVNFEPCVLMLILAALLAFRMWCVSGRIAWRRAALTLLCVGLWVDWAMYLFALTACVILLAWRNPEGKRLARLILMLALVSIGCYFLRIRVLRPDAWSNLMYAFVYRIGSAGGIHFTEAQWLKMIAGNLARYFLPGGWALAAVGAWVTWKTSGEKEGLRWLGLACLAVAGMDAIFIACFQNESYIHDYIPYYLLAPVSIMAGIAIESTVRMLERRIRRPAFGSAGVAAALFILIAVGIGGTHEEKVLRRQFHILALSASEPPELIPMLGQTIRGDFPKNTVVLCNFLPIYSPELGYYAQRDLLNNMTEGRFWIGVAAKEKRPLGGVIWMNCGGAAGIVSHLPSGRRRFMRIGRDSFCIWSRNTASLPISKMTSRHRSPIMDSRSRAVLPHHSLISPLPPLHAFIIPNIPGPGVR